MKCEICKEVINLTIFGMSNDICWACLEDKRKKELLDKNLTLTSKTIKYKNEK